MLAWLLGIDLGLVVKMLGVAFLTIIALLSFISYEVYEIKKNEEDKNNP